MASFRGLIVATRTVTAINAINPSIIEIKIRIKKSPP
jgi:hypothetical protein